MHVGVNAQLLSYSESYRNGGISRYIRHFLTGLSQHPGQHTYTVFVNGKEAIQRLGISHPQIEFIPSPWPEERPISRVVWEQTALPRLIRDHKLDLFHSPANVLPRGVPKSCVTVVTVHDLAFLRMPEVMRPAKRLYHRTLTVQSLHKASHIITDSDSTGRDVVDLLKIPGDRLSTVYPSVDIRFAAQISDGEAQSHRLRHGLPEGYLLYMGTLEPRKNIPNLLEAFANLRKTQRSTCKLVLAGGKGWLYDSIFAKVRELGLVEDVVFPGFVPDAEQALWYHAASAFAFPSRYEGFGIPVAEALACGTPVVTSSVSSLPEAGAGLALTVDPDNVPALTAALDQALHDSALRDRCRAQAEAVRERFSPLTMATQIIAAYERAAG